MPRVLLSLSLLVAVLWIAPPAQAAPDVVFEGSGWGHGVGMSQYGAYGMATEGATAPEILAHYFRGTSVIDQAGTTAASFLGNPEPIWVGLTQHRSSLTFRLTGGGGDLCQNGDDEGPCPKAVRPEAGETWVFEVTGDGECTFRRTTPADPPLVGTPGDCDASVTPDDGAVLHLPSEGRSYDAGTLRLRQDPSSATFHVSLQLSVQDYLLGVAEMPTTWPSEALQAQVIAARSYAFARASSRGPESAFSTATKDDCWCHLYDDTRSQVYAGNAIAGSTSWRNAVTSTNRQVVASGGTLVTAFYSSSSGGRTENVEDVWGGGPTPWLRSVDDRFAKLPAVGNPYASWTRTRPLAEVAAQLDLDTLSSIAVATRPSGGVDSVTFVGKRDGASSTVVKSGSWVRSRFGLPSVYFDATATGLTPPSAYDAPEGGKAPFGWIDGVTGGAGQATVRGWALDPDTPLPINVHVYVDGAFVTGLRADDPRPDVGRAHGLGDLHGFSKTIELAPGTRTVCVYAINAPSRTSNPRIGCRTVSVSSTVEPTETPVAPVQPSTASKPFGWIDSVKATTGGVALRGWAIDADDPDAAVGIHVYVDGAFAGGSKASIGRPDVERAHGMGPNHGFSFTVGATRGTHTVCVYAIDVPTRSGNPQLGCRTVTVP